VFEDGSRSYFPDRKPKTMKFNSDELNPTDQYARLYSDRVVVWLCLSLPRYGLGNYLTKQAEKIATPKRRSKWIICLAPLTMMVQPYNLLSD
jgi:hypothetical protein